MSTMYYYLRSMFRQMAGIKKRRYDVMDDRWGQMIGYGYEKDCVWMHHHQLGNIDLTIRMKGTNTGPEEIATECFWKLWSMIKENEGNFIKAFQQLFAQLGCEFSNQELGEMTLSLSTLGDELWLSGDKFFAIIHEDGTIHLNVGLTTSLQNPIEVKLDF